ncbi:MAG: CpXC domain-containing protein [Anaerolineales bacterium]|nr:CpXC domain-containing protein [Anaerolineales bacterium]
MPRTMISCPNCRQPIQADVRQLFDLAADPTAKQALLSGAANLVNCPLCGFTGNLATPLVYHDPDKELLLTFVPPELNLPQPEQERLLGGLINQVVNALPQEKRKGYLLRPQQTLTQQGLVERVLEADGITREMLQAQQQRLILIQRMQQATPDVLAELARQEDANIDAEFFGLLNTLVQTTAMGGDENAARQLSELSKNLLPLTTYGKQVLAQSAEIEAAIASLKEAGQELTREKLLDLVLQAPNETRLRALASLARPGMDYQFFQILSERIEGASAGNDKEKLTTLRENLLEMTAAVDKQLETRLMQSRKLLNQIIQAKDIRAALQQALPAIDEFFMQVFDAEMKSAAQQGDQEKVKKLQEVLDILKEASQLPPEVEFIEELLSLPDDDARQKAMESQREKVTPEFLSTLANLAYQLQESNDAQVAEGVKALHRLAVKFSMAESMKKG